MNGQRQISGTSRASRHVVRGAMTVGLTSVVLAAFAASAAFAAPTPEDPPAPTGTITTLPGGTVEVNLTGTWAWAVGSGGGKVAATSGQSCGKDFGAGWAMVWNDPADPGYTVSYKGQSIGVGSNVTTLNAKDRSVHYNSSAPCGTYSAGSPVTGPWGEAASAGSATHIYTSVKALPIRSTQGPGICTVTYTLKASPPRKRQLNVKRNKSNSFRAAGGTLTTAACIRPQFLRADPTIVTTSTNAQAGAAITDTATLSGTSQDLKVGTGKSNPTTLTNAGGSVTFELYGPGDSTCSATPVFTSGPLPVNGDGTYGPVSYTPTQGAGDYQWIAAYHGSHNNNSATELCGASGETSTLSPAPVTGTGGSGGTGGTGSTGGTGGTGSTGSSGSSGNSGSTGSTGSSGTSGTSGSTSANPSTSPAASVSGASTTSATTATATPITGATTVHTGEPWAGSKPFVVLFFTFGLSLMGLGYFQRRRLTARIYAEESAS